MMISKFNHIIGPVISVILISGCGEEVTFNEHRDAVPVIEGVVVEKLMPLEVTEFYEASGTVRSVNTSVISSKIMGEVRDIRVRASDHVKKGDVLLVINSPDTAARFKAATEALEEADKALKMSEENKVLMEKTFNRFQILYKEKAVSEQEFDEIRTKRDVTVMKYERARNSYKKADAALEEAEAYKDYAVVRSHLNGIIADKKIDVGSLAVPGTPLIFIEEPNYRVEADIDESMISAITTGTPVNIVIDALGIETEGSVGEIVRAVDPATRTFTVKIDMEERTEALRGGVYARVRFPVDKKTKLFIDEIAVIIRGELRGVYAVDDEGLITLRIVKIGKKKDGRFEILSGITAGERVIVNGAERAVDGGRVK